MSLIRIPGFNPRLKMRKKSITLIGENESIEGSIKVDGKTPHYFIFDEGIVYMDTKPFTLDQARRETEEEEG